MLPGVSVTIFSSQTVLGFIPVFGATVGNDCFTMRILTTSQMSSLDDAPAYDTVSLGMTGVTDDVMRFNEK
jgi:hypothetical protein